jgi:hypothetical protein
MARAAWRSVRGDLTPVQPRKRTRPTEHAAKWVPARVTRRCSSQQATQERRGATVAARTVAFLFARACNGRDTARAFTRICGTR